MPYPRASLEVLRYVNLRSEISLSPKIFLTVGYFPKSIPKVSKYHPDSLTRWTVHCSPIILAFLLTMGLWIIQSNHSSNNINWFESGEPWTKGFICGYICFVYIFTFLHCKHFLTVFLILSSASSVNKSFETSIYTKKRLKIAALLERHQDF